MTIKNKVIFFVLLLLALSDALANDAVKITTQVLDESGHNLFVSKEINLNEINRSFKKKLSKYLNKRECERSIFLKKANLSVSNKRLVVDFTTRITRQYCTRRAKKQLYEKTKNIHYQYDFDLSTGKFIFVETDDQKKYTSFNRSLSDVMGKNAQNTIAVILLKVLELETHDISESLGLVGNYKYRLIKFDSDKLVFYLSAFKSKEHQ